MQGDVQRVWRLEFGLILRLYKFAGIQNSTGRSEQDAVHSLCEGGQNAGKFKGRWSVLLSKSIVWTPPPELCPWVTADEGDEENPMIHARSQPVKRFCWLLRCARILMLLLQGGILLGTPISSPGGEGGCSQDGECLRSALIQRLEAGGCGGGRGGHLWG